jgi:hypothetical protein
MVARCTASFSESAIAEVAAQHTTAAAQIGASTFINAQPLLTDNLLLAGDLGRRFL